MKRIPYDAPAMEVVELKMEGIIATSPNGGGENTNWGGGY